MFKYESINEHKSTIHVSSKGWSLCLLALISNVLNCSCFCSAALKNSEQNDENKHFFVGEVFMIIICKDGNSDDK